MLVVRVYVSVKSTLGVHVHECLSVFVVGTLSLSMFGFNFEILSSIFGSCQAKRGGGRLARDSACNT